MLLRLRVRLPDRAGSLGQVARTLGVAGADIVQMVVLERISGRAVDDFTVIWPAAAPVDRIMAGLGAIPGVTVEGVWRSVGATPLGGADAELIGQLAANREDGLATLVDATPGLLSADWAAVLTVPADWADSGCPTAGNAAADHIPVFSYASWRAPDPLRPLELTPVRPRAFDGAGGVRYATAPFGRAGLVLLVARGGVGGELAAPSFHVTEVDRLAQLVRASALVLADQLDLVTAAAERSTPQPRPPWPVNTPTASLTAALDS